MANRIEVTTETTQKINAAGAEFARVVRELIGDISPEGDAECSFTASVCIQSVVRGLALQRNEDGDWAMAALQGAGEGLGFMLGLVPEPLRAVVYEATSRAVLAGMRSNAKIHDTQGNA